MYNQFSFNDFLVVYSRHHHHWIIRVDRYNKYKKKHQKEKVKVIQQIKIGLQQSEHPVKYTPYILLHMHKKFHMFNNKLMFKLSFLKIYCFSSATYSNSSRKCPHTQCFPWTQVYKFSENVKNKTVQEKQNWCVILKVFFFSIAVIFRYLNYN